MTGNRGFKEKGAVLWWSSGQDSKNKVPSDLSNWYS